MLLLRIQIIVFVLYAVFVIKKLNYLQRFEFIFIHLQVSMKSRTKFEEKLTQKLIRYYLNGHLDNTKLKARLGYGITDQ